MNSTAKSALPPSHVNLGPLEDSLEFFIGRANTILLRAWALRWDDTGLRPRYFNALALVGSNPGISLIEVARLYPSVFEMESRMIEKLLRARVKRVVTDLQVEFHITEPKVVEEEVFRLEP